MESPPSPPSDSPAEGGEIAALRLRCAQAEAANKALTEKNTALTEENKALKGEVAALKPTACLEQGGAFPKRPRVSVRAAAATRALRPTPDVPIKALFDVCCAGNILAYRSLRLCARVCKDWRARAESAANLLTVLDMSKTFADLGDVQAALQATAGRRLVALDLSRTSGLADTAERAGELAALIKPTAPTLKSFALSKADVADAAFPALLQVIGTCSKLEHLDLHGNRKLLGSMGNSELGTAPSALSALTCLRILDLGGTTIAPHALGVALQRTSALQCLRLKRVRLTSSPSKAFEQGLSRQASLSELDFRRSCADAPVLRSIWRALSCMPYMRRLLLCLPFNLPAGDTQFDNLMRKALCDMPFLEHLQIDDMMESSWAAIAGSARGGSGWPCLTFLGLEAQPDTPLTDAACQPIAHVLACTPSLRSLTLRSGLDASSRFSAAGGIALWSALGQLSQLETLELGACEIGAECTEALGEAVANMSSLQNLFVKFKNLNGKAQHSFKMRIPRNVQIVDLE